MEDGGEVTESLAIDDALVGDLCSLHQSEVDWIDCEHRDVEVALSGSESKFKAETLRATRSRVVWGLTGTLIPSSMAIRKNCWSISSSVQLLASCSTVIL